MTIPTCPAVRSLYSLQNAIILTPCGPSAVPIGGAGLAFPAGICSFTTALTRFAILFHTPVYFTLIQPHARYYGILCWVRFSQPAENPERPGSHDRKTKPAQSPCSGPYLYR